MEIKPIKKVRTVHYSGIEQEDFLQRPQIKTTLKDNPQATGFEYAQRRLYWNGQEVGQVIRETATQNPQMLAKLANDLETFKDDAAKRRKRRFFWSRKLIKEFSDDDLGVILSLCDAYILRISELIKERYDQTKDGMNVVFDESGQLLLNGMNIHSLIENCRENPTEKSLVFLKGIRSRLGHVLQNKINSRNYDRIQEVVKGLLGDIEKILID
ncbi:MAG: hypothetical protein ACD_62C00523G0003 [uncultured bacterium]|nr:MAG: hypothetical protein ACD_62C00523G0003 [uncultured bacterium]